ncbi:hypothetical protein [Desulfovibrio inopinatus]|uniref:hypothetical protein n=1 Tax=Desulfovibrio inopinatus TaxID=102109 RepID=UPI0005567CF4|nr:hypothetical protein [Desulfovibrio inopinatus]
MTMKNCVDCGANVPSFTKRCLHCGSKELVLELKDVDLIEDEDKNKIKSNINKNNKQKTTLIDIEIPFWRIVWILVKIAIAGVPAAIIITIIVSFVGFITIFFLGAIALHP